MLYTSSKGDRESLRYKMTAYTKGRNMRLPFIVMEKNDILSNSAELFCTAQKDSEWFSTSVSDNMIPIITDHIGRIAGQQFSPDSVNNLHFFATGISGKGKTHCLTERMCSLQRKGVRAVIFDTSDSFTKKSVIRNISADDIPVEPLKLNYNSYNTTIY